MYTKIDSIFWQDKKILSISEKARYLMLYFFTTRHRNILGFYFLPIPYACFDLGWDEKQFKKVLDELIKEDLVKYDFETNVIFICNYLKYNPLENSNQVKSAINKLNELPATPLFQDLLTILEQIDKPFMIPLLERVTERVTETSISRSKSISKSISKSNSISEKEISKEKEKEINKEREKEISPNGDVGSDEPTDCSSSVKEIFNYYNEVFKDCWSKPLLLTPQRKKKISARLKNFTPEELKIAIRNIRASPFHCGNNDKGRIYATPDFIFRNDETVDKWLKEKPRYGGVQGYDPPQVIEEW